MPKLAHKTIQDFPVKKKPYYRSDGGNGLYIKVTPKNKYWVWRYSFKGVRQAPLKLHKWHSGGNTKEGRKEANEKIREFEKLIYKGINPRTQRVLEQGIPTFSEMWEIWHKKQKPNPKLLQKKKQWTIETWNKAQGRVEKHIFPVLGEIPINQIDTGALFDFFESFEDKAYKQFAMMETRDFCKSYIKRVLDYSQAKGFITHNPYYSIDHTQLATTEHSNYATTTDEKGIATIMAKLDLNIRGSWQVRLATRLAVHLMLRPSEIAEMKWSEVFMKERKLIITFERMKKRREHDVPMSNQVYEIFKELIDLKKSDYVFPSVNVRNKKPYIGIDGMRTRLRSSGITDKQLTTHGFRAMAATIITGGMDDGETYELSWVKKQLSHKIGSKSDQAYMRAAYFQKRKRMLQNWSDTLDRINKEWGNEVLEDLS
jgi:integrase